MEVVLGPEHCTPPAEGSAVTIGAYDGVHLGHRHLIERLGAMADGRGLASVVVTFDRHPATVVRPESAPLLLTDLDQKLELLAETGVARTVVVPFDETRARESAEDFVDEVLVQALGARLVVVGSDFHFGHGRRGNVALLSSMGETRGFDVVGLDLESDRSGDAVSSTRIRGLLGEGDVRRAAELLGRHHQVRGVVVHDVGRGGAELGFPTANVELPEGIALPSEGIYACWYERPDGALHAAAASLGRRPTFDTGVPDHPVLEAHLLDFQGDLYGETARVSFVDRLRDDLRFDSVDALVAQMRRDVEAARAVLADAAPTRAVPRGPGASRADATAGGSAGGAATALLE
ncbi:MAG TPA: bifunctional riboflavin kinase/FAD synthetase [Acidimicrobiales bacterium]|nr:bifunctional riboflavin kinase/FAD synthetase [Acidimicrobiales bacterium]